MSVANAMHVSALYERFIKALACLINFTTVQLIAYLLNAYILYISLRERLINVDMTGLKSKNGTLWYELRTVFVPTIKNKRKGTIK